MKGLFIPDITTEMFRNGCLEGIEALMAEGELYDIEYNPKQPTIEPERKKGKWIYGESEAGNDGYYCSKCGNFVPWKYDEYDIDFIKEFLFCNKCGAEMEGQDDRK